MSQPFIGEIRMFGGDFAPTGWAICNGALLSIAQNTALFSLIGIAYGGDGQLTFALPNLQGRLPLHQGSGFAMGQSGGSETVTLTVNQIPSHRHAASCDTNPGDQEGPVNYIWAPPSTRVAQYSSLAPTVGMDPSAIQPAGGSQPHENMMPFVVISFIISLFGVFPSRP